jgi:phenylalanyl-tRNA synthetase beta chain
MRVSVNWIKEFTQIDTPLDKLVDDIGSRLVEVEEIIDWGKRYEGIVVAKIIDKQEHPNADKLAVYKVTVGNGQAAQVVSGDRSLEINDLVGYIAPGRIVPSTYDDPVPVTMEVRPLRGIESAGMFGSAKELMIGMNHEKVQVLDVAVEPGSPLADAYQLHDMIIDIDNKSFTHRPDAFGLIGFAREVAAIEGIRFESPDWFKNTTSSLDVANVQMPLSVDNQAADLCPRFMAIALSGISMSSSPLSLQSMLVRMGIRPISTIVDITNYMMLLTGQPLHAYDYDKLSALQGTDSEGVRLVVRRAQKGDILTLLDGRDIAVREGALLIATPTQPVGLAGIMGGLSTEIDDETRNIVLEAANFDMYNLRSTSMTHGIFTDALTRFSKGQSPSICAPVLGQATRMILDLVPGSLVASKPIDIYDHPKQEVTINCRVSKINALLGTEFTSQKIQTTLENAEFKVTASDDDHIEVVVPLWRSDIHIAEDIAEEVGRLNGFDKIEPNLPIHPMSPTMPTSLHILEQKIRHYLSGAGANELPTYSFISEKLVKNTGQDSKLAYHLANSISPELAYVRTTILPSLLARVQPNHKNGYPSFAAFEINLTESHAEIEEDSQLPVERDYLAFVYSAIDKAYDTEKQGNPFYQAKHYLQALFDHVKIKNVEYAPLSDYDIATLPMGTQLRVPIFDPRQSAVIKSRDRVLGIIGTPKQQIKTNLKLPQAIAMFECEVTAMNDVREEISDYTPLSRFPATEQDVCFKVANNVSYSVLANAVTQFLAQSDIKTVVSPVDIYQRADDTEHKQITIRIRLQHTERTLRTEEVNDLLSTLADHVNETLHGERI